MSSEEEFRRLAVELRILEGTAESLQSRINFLNVAFNELNVAKTTIKGLKKEEIAVPLFVPIGGGSYIKAKLDNIDKVVYGVGAGVAVEKSLNEAQQGIENRISELEKTRKSMEQQLTQILRRIQDGQSRFQALTRTSRNRERR